MIKNRCNKAYINFISDNEQDKKKSLLYIDDILEYSYNNYLSLSEIKEIIELESKLLSVSGKYKFLIEKQLFYIITKTVNLILDDNDYRVVYLDEIRKEHINNNDDDNNKSIYLIIESCMKFFNHKKERDSFNTKRKILITITITLM